MKRTTSTSLAGLTCLLLVACEPGASTGTLCSVDSDCETGSWCDAAEGTCQPIECVGMECPLPEDYSTQPPQATTNVEGEVEQLKQQIQNLEDQLAALEESGAGSSETCSAQDDPDRVVLRITSMGIGIGGVPGQGFDLDDDPETCFPPANEDAGLPACSDGIDNAICGIAKLVNPFLENDLPPLALVHSPQCDEMYLLEETSGEGAFDPINWTKQFAVDGVAASETVLETEGTGTWVILIPLPFGGGSTLRVQATGVRMEAQYDTETQSWKGILGGWASESALKAALASFTTEDLDGTPPETARSIVMQLADRDTNGDGTPDSVSLGFVFEATVLEEGDE